MAAEPRVFRALRSVLVESIFWDERTEELCWVDITAGTFHRARLDGAEDGSDDRVVALPPPVSAVQPAAGGGFVAALRDRVVLLDEDGAERMTLAVLDHAHDGIRCNEGKVDPFGRFLVGGMDVTTGRPDASLFLVDAAGTVRALRGGFTVANGFEWSAEGDVAYVTDTATATVYRAAYSDGPPFLGDLEPFLVGHASDGLVRITDGGFWNAVYGGGEILRWSDDAAVVERVAIPAPNVTSVAFGGPAYDVLFVGSARENLTEAQLHASPLSGSLFVVADAGSGTSGHTFGAPQEPHREGN